MSTAIIVSLIAVGISLLAVFTATHAAKSTKRKKAEGDGGTTAASTADSGSSDCGSDGGGGCD